jgi:hypothetical protein
VKGKIKFTTNISGILPQPLKNVFSSLLFPSTQILTIADQDFKLKYKTTEVTEYTREELE